MEAKSVITFPSGEMKLPGPGFYEVTGIAWSGRGRVKRVEVSPTAESLVSRRPAGSGACRLPYPLPLPVEWDGQPAVLQSRCTDETGYMQPTLEQLVAVAG